MQLTNKQTLIAYGVTGATAIAGYYNQAYLAFGMFILFTLSISLTIFGVD